MDEGVNEGLGGQPLVAKGWGVGGDALDPELLPVSDNFRIKFKIEKAGAGEEVGLGETEGDKK